MSAVFTLASLLVMPFWAMMILLPGWRWTERVVRSPWSVAPAAALYAVLVVPRLGELLPVLADPTLPEVGVLLGSDAGATIAWIHFLAFDYFVGRWMYLDARERGVSAWVMGPLLLTTILLGPLGLLIYLLVRRGAGRERYRGGAVGRAMDRALEVNGPLAMVAAAMVPLFLLAVGGVLFDERTITGAPAWMKPAKFAGSIAIYSFTLLWLLGRVRGRRRLVWWTATASAVALAAEWVVIATQAFRGVRSHFNVATPLDATLFSAMGAFIIVIWCANVVAAVLLIAQPEEDRAFAWSLRIGLVIAALGGAMGGAMLRPNSDQAIAIERGLNPTMVGAHSVGVADGGPGLPLVGWSTQGGDVRAAHFFGLHGLQVLPLFGWWISRRRGVIEQGHRVALVWTAGAAYLGFVAILFWQALRGEALVAPGLATRGALVVLGGLTVVSTASILIHRWRTMTRAPAAIVARAGLATGAGG